MLDRVLRELQQEPQFAGAIAASRLQSPAPETASPVMLRGDVDAALRRLRIPHLFEHQVAALQLARNGHHVVVATPTATGKTLCFNLPVLEDILARLDRGLEARALMLFPLKALEQDQLKRLGRLQDALDLRQRFRAAILDGDTPESVRRTLRQEPPHFLLSNPDMLHASLLPGHEHWGRFFADLRWIVLDELHTYRGVFGSHVLHVLRRLRRVAAHYGAQPQVIAASATIQNPGELASRLFGLPFETVRGNPRPRGPRQVFLLDPPDGALAFATTLFARLVQAGVKTIAFCNSRRATELLFSWSVERHPQLRGRISAYRSGYLASERREIEAALFGGHLRGVVSTSALEMGIDVGGLDAAILVGYPGSIMSTWQRGGRAGRGKDPAALFLVAGHDALDQYWLTSPDAFFAAEPECAVVDPNNSSIRASHLLCAGAELPLVEVERAYDDLDWASARQILQQRGLLLQSVRGDSWVPLPSRPHQSVDIRQIGDSYTIHPAGRERRLLGTIGGSRVLAECHEGAVYLHRGRHLRVAQLDLERRRVLVEPTDGTAFTVARSAKQTEILEVHESRQFGACTVSFGRLRITQRITGYDRRSSFDQKLLGSFELDLPPTIYETVGLWIEIDPGIEAALATAGQHRMGSLHGIEHAFIALSPLFTLCDAADLGGITLLEHPQLQRPAIFVYDSYPGGIGLAARTYEILPQVLRAVAERVQRCGCDEGCPGCVHSPRCGAGNYPLDKAGTRTALRLLLDTSRPAPPRASDTGRPQAADPPAAAAPATLASKVPGDASAAASSVVTTPRGTLVEGAGAPRVLCLDVETRFGAREVGGWKHIDCMGVALAVIYDAQQRAYETYFEPDVPQLVETLRQADLVVGYNLIRFDYRVLSGYSRVRFERIPTFDMLVELRSLLGFRISLESLAQATLGRGKSADGEQSLAWVRQGQLDRVEQYCRDDVTLTWEIFRRALERGWLAFERKGMLLRTPPLRWELGEIVRSRAKVRAVRLRDAQQTLFVPPLPRAAW